MPPSAQKVAALAAHLLALPNTSAHMRHYASSQQRLAELLAPIGAPDREQRIAGVCAAIARQWGKLTTEEQQDH